MTKPIARYGTDEIGQTAAVTNAMLSKIQGTVASYERARQGLQAMVGQVQQSAEGLAGTSQQLGAAANQTSGAVQQVTDAVQQVARGAQEQSGSAQDSNRSVEQLLEAIDPARAA